MVTYEDLNPHTLEIPDRDVVLFSGGLDSAVTSAILKSLNKNPLLLFVDTGCEDIEWSKKAAKSVADKLGLELIVDGGMAEHMSERCVGDNLYVPYRNLLFAITAAKYGSRIYMAGIKGDFSPDKSPEAFEAMLGLMNSINGPNEKISSISSMLWKFNKVEVAKIGVALAGEWIVLDTLGCYHPTSEGKHCGSCLACFRKHCLLHALGINADGYFASDPNVSPAAEAYRNMLERGEWSENIPETVAREVLNVSNHS